MTITKFFFHYSSFNLDSFSEKMLTLNLKSGIPYFVYVASSSGKILGSGIIFIIKKNNKKDPIEYLLSPNEDDNSEESLKRLYQNLSKKLDSLVKNNPSIKECFYLYVYTN
jgi:hypothetical protein